MRTAPSKDMFIFNPSVSSAVIIFKTDYVVYFWRRDFMKYKIAKSDNSVFSGRSHNKKIICLRSYFFNHSVIILKPNLCITAYNVICLVFSVMILETSPCASVYVNAFGAIKVVEFKPNFFSPGFMYNLCLMFRKHQFFSLVHKVFQYLLNTLS